MKRSSGLQRKPFAVPLSEDGTPRWSSLTRSAEMPRGTGFRPPSLALVAGDGAPVVQLRPAPRYTGPDAATRKLVLERDGWACVCCGRSVIGQPYSLQHRKRRSQGGTNDPSNLVVVLGLGGQLCHGRIDSRRDPEDEAKGYSLRSWDNPALVPVMVFGEHGSGVTAWLTPDGRYAYEPPEGAA